MAEAVQIAGLLRSCQLFRGLSDSDLLALAARVSRRRTAAGHYIFHAGDAGDGMIGLLAGEVRITRTEPSGAESILASLVAGDVFGEMAVLDGMGRSADAIALTACELIILDRRDFIAFLERNSTFAVSVLALLSRRLRLADQRAADFLHLSLQARLAKALLGGPATPEAGRGRISTSQQELARIVGASRPRVNQHLKAWERAGMIEMRKGWIVVHSPDRLGAIAAAD